MTISAAEGTRPFAFRDLANEMVNSLREAKEKNGFSLYCYCLMPDHLHLALSPAEEGPDVIETIRRLKGITTRKAWQHGLSGTLWQRSFYDHVARREEDVYKICEYIVNNPVRAGIVQNAGEYPFCGLVDPI